VHNDLEAKLTDAVIARLAVVRIWRQRVSCGECQQTLERSAEFSKREYMLHSAMNSKLRRTGAGHFSTLI
jgi:hypothetical protein